MITMARIQGSSMGYPSFQKPILQMGQNSFQSGPIGAGVTPPAAPVFPTPVFPNYIYPPDYAYLTQEQPVVTPTPTGLPTWAVVGLAVVAGAAVAALVIKK